MTHEPQPIADLIRRLIVIDDALSSRGGASKHDLAEQLGVSDRTVRRMIASIGLIRDVESETGVYRYSKRGRLFEKSAKSES